MAINLKNHLFILMNPEELQAQKAFRPVEKFINNCIYRDYHIYSTPHHLTDKDHPEIYEKFQRAVERSEQKKVLKALRSRQEKIRSQQRKGK